MRGTGRATFAAILLLIVGTLNIIYGIGALDSANIFVNDHEVHPHEPQHAGLGPDRPRRDPAHRRLLAVRRQHLRPGDRDHRRQPRCDRGAAVDRRRQPVVVAGHLRPVRLDRLRHLRLRRGRARAGSLSSLRTGADGGRRSARARAARESRARRAHAHVLAAAGVRAARRQPVSEGGGLRPLDRAGLRRAHGHDPADDRHQRRGLATRGQGHGRAHHRPLRADRGRRRGGHGHLRAALGHEHEPRHRRVPLPPGRGPELHPRRAAAVRADLGARAR